MTTATLLLSAAFSVASAALYAVVGNAVPRPRPGEEGRLAALLFALWWWSLAGLLAIGAGFNAAAAAGMTDLGVHLAFLQVALLVICVALWALAYYLLYVFTGRRGLVWPLATLYAGLYLVLVYLVALARPDGVEVGTWQTTVTYARPLDDEPWARYVGLLLVAPLVLGALAYASLFVRVRERLQRYRIALVSGAFILWFGTSTVASVVGWTDASGWAVASRLISLAAAGVVLLAFRPPAVVARWLGRRDALAAPTAPGMGT